MNKLNRNQIIAVSAGLALIFVLFFSDPVLKLFGLSTNNDNANQSQQTMSEPSIKTQEVAVGQGEVAQPGDELTVHYIGALENGQVFDSSRDSNTPFKFTLGAGQVIQGWDKGLEGMRVGGKRVVVVPPEFGYGAQAIGAIPPNSTLIFEVELLDVKKPQ